MDRSRVDVGEHKQWYGKKGKAFPYTSQCANNSKESTPGQREARDVWVLVDPPAYIDGSHIYILVSYI